MSKKPENYAYCKFYPSCCYCHSDSELYCVINIYLEYKGVSACNIS